DAQATEPVQAAVRSDIDTQPADDETTGGSPSFIARLRTWVRDTRLIERMNGDVDGWYPRIGGITRGSGFAAGPGYRVPLFNATMRADLSAALSIKGYTAVDARLRLLQTSSRRTEVWTEFRGEHLPEEDYVGVGMATSDATRTSYGLDTTDMRLRWLLR